MYKIRELITNAEKSNVIDSLNRCGYVQDANASAFCGHDSYRGRDISFMIMKCDKYEAEEYLQDFSSNKTLQLVQNPKFFVRTGDDVVSLRDSDLDSDFGKRENSIYDNLDESEIRELAKIRDDLCSNRFGAHLYETDGEERKTL